MNNSRLSKKKQVQLLVALTILAWATQTLMHQWGYGQTVDAVMDTPVDEKFVPSAADSTPSGTLELRQDATVSGPEVKLKQVCRWSDADSAAFTPVADLTVLQIPRNVSFQSVSIEEISQTLHEAGVNVAMINFAGATSCSITRSDPQSDSQQTMQQWIDNQAAPADKGPSTSDPKSDPSFHTLRELLTNDLSQRLNIPAGNLQISFSPQDEKLLALAEPIFKFDISPSRARALGNVSWEVTVSTDAGGKKVTVGATARAWQDEVVVAQPVAAHTVSSAEDFAVRRVLIDSSMDKQLLTLDQCVGQEAAESLRIGTVMTAPLVNPVALVKPGQLVTVNLRRGTVQLRAVVRAMEAGSLGQSIRVRNENTKDVLDVTVIGAQEARLGDEQGN